MSHFEGALDRDMLSPEQQARLAAARAAADVLGARSGTLGAIVNPPKLDDLIELAEWLIEGSVEDVDTDDGDDALSLPGWLDEHVVGTFPAFTADKPVVWAYGPDVDPSLIRSQQVVDLAGAARRAKAASDAAEAADFVHLGYVPADGSGVDYRGRGGN